MQKHHHYVLLFVVMTIVNTVTVCYRTKSLMLAESVACASHHYLNRGVWLAGCCWSVDQHAFNQTSRYLCQNGRSHFRTFFIYFPWIMHLFSPLLFVSLKPWWYMLYNSLSDFTTTQLTSGHHISIRRRSDLKLTGCLQDRIMFGRDTRWPGLVPLLPNWISSLMHKP